MTGRVDQMQQVILPLVIIHHRAGLRLHGDAAFALHIQLVEELLLPARLDGAGQLQQAVAERALAMVDVRDDAEAPEAVDGDLRDALLQLRLDLQRASRSGERNAEGSREAVADDIN